MKDLLNSLLKNSKNILLSQDVFYDGLIMFSFSKKKESSKYVLSSIAFGKLRWKQLSQNSLVSCIVFVPLSNDALFSSLFFLSAYSYFLLRKNTSLKHILYNYFHNLPSTVTIPYFRRHCCKTNTEQCLHHNQLNVSWEQHYFYKTTRSTTYFPLIIFILTKSCSTLDLHLFITLNDCGACDIAFAWE